MRKAGGLDRFAIVEVHTVPFFFMEEPIMQSPAAEYPIEVAEADCHGFVANYFGTVDLGHQSRNR